jgi:hypothetical protein
MLARLAGPLIHWETILGARVRTPGAAAKNSKPNNSELRQFRGNIQLGRG